MREGEQAAERARNVRFLLLDVDGVLTDGRLGFLEDSTEVKFFSIYDGLGIRLAQVAEIGVGILSARESPQVTARAKQLGIQTVVQGSGDKGEDVGRIAEATAIPLDAMAFVGDDLLDLPALRRVGFTAAPANGVAAVREEVDYVAEARGGDGAVREIVEFVLRSQGRLEEAINAMLEA